MSTVILKLAPLIPRFVPSEVQANDARECLVRLAPDGYEHEVRIHGNPEFIDPGEYLSAAICPTCGSTISFDVTDDFEASTKWMSELCRQLAIAPAGSLRCSLPWCGHMVLITSLEFEPSAVFASCELRVVEPLIEDNQLAELVAAISRVFGVPMMHVWSSY